MKMPQINRPRWIATTIITLAVMVLVFGCARYSTPSPQRSFTTEELLIDLSDMPPDWTVIRSGKLPIGPDNLSTDDSAWVSFQADGHSPYRPTQQFVYRYRNSPRARQVYNDFVFEKEYTPSAWTYQSPVAEETKFGCYDYEGREPYPICEWSGRYEEYVVQVLSWTIADRMSLQELEQVIQAIDVRMAQYLDKPFVQE